MFRALLLFFVAFPAFAFDGCKAIEPRPAIEYFPGQLLDAFVPAGEPRSFAIVIHGASGNRRTHLNQVLSTLEKAGWAWFSLDYRNPPDLEAASAFIQCPGRFNIRGKPVLIAEDQGGPLAFALSQRINAASVVVFGLPANAQLPALPVLLFHGEYDEESPIAPIRALCHSSPNCTLVPIPKAIHNVENWHPDQWFWKEDLIAWLRGNQRGQWRDIPYAMPDGRPLFMDAFLPEGSGPFSAVIVVHGGGWEAGDKETYISPILDILSHSRLAYFSIDYRLTPYVDNATQLDDVRSAIRYVRDHADRFHVRADAISLFGESAGGQLVTQVASLPCPGCTVKSVVSLYGVYDFTQFSHDVEGRQMLTRIFGHWTESSLKQASPLNNISPSLPPLLLIQGTKDELYPGTLSYHAALDAKSLPNTLIVLDGAPHGMENWVNNPDWFKALQNIPAWLGISTQN